MYLTKAWTEDLRPAQLMKEPFCRACIKLGARTRARAVDHVIPHRGDWQLFSDRSNLQSLCSSHHNAKTAQEMRERTRKTK